MCHEPTNPVEDPSDLSKETTFLEVVCGRPVDDFQQIVTDLTEELKNSPGWQSYEITNVTIVPASTDSQSSTEDGLGSRLNTVLDRYGISNFEVEEVQMCLERVRKGRFCTFYITLIKGRGIRFGWFCQ